MQAPTRVLTSTFSAALALSTVLALSCRQEETRSVESKPAPPTNPSAAEPASKGASEEGAAPKEPFARAQEARDMMQKKLLEELTAALEKGGQAAAISICKERAPAIAKEVGEKMGLKIGRTSFRLRNPANAAPAWASPLVLTYRPPLGKDAQLPLPDGGLGVLLPIRVTAVCLPCHGDPRAMLPDVRATLRREYPSDNAIGFRDGDLRGWFWIEVPPEGQKQ